MFTSSFKPRLILTSLLLLCLFIPAVTAQDDEIDYCREVAEEIEYGDTVEGSIDDEFFAAFYCFEGEEGDEVTITVTTTDGDLVSMIFVADPFAQDEFDSDTARSDNDEAEVSLTLEEDEDYLVIVTREDIDEGDTEGEFELNIEAETSRSSSSSSGGGGNSNDDLETSCDEEPLATLSQYQFGIAGSNPERPLMTYNVGCTGFLVITTAGVSEIGQYEIDRRGNMSFTIGDSNVVFTSGDVSDDEWIIEIGNGQELVLERIEIDDCDEEPLSDLIRGAWLIEETVIDFTCNGVALMTVEGETSVADYEIDRDDILITGESVELLLENFEIDDNVLRAEVDGDDVELENLLD